MIFKRILNQSWIYESYHHGSIRSWLIHITVFFWSWFLPYWIESHLFESYQPSFGGIWINSHFVWFISIFMAYLFVFCCLNRITHYVNRFTMMFLAKFLHLPLLPIYTHILITPKLLNHLHQFSLESSYLIFHLFLILNNFSKNHCGLWVIDCYSVIGIVSWLLSRILIGNQGSKANLVISFHLQGYWGFFSNLELKGIQPSDGAKKSLSEELIEWVIEETPISKGI